MDAKKIWSYARRLLAIIPSIFICALGVALLVWPEWGCDPLTTFEIGLSNVFHVQFGTVALVFEGIMFFVFFFVRRDLVHLGTLAWCFLIGPFENFWLDVLAPMLPTAPEMSVGLKIACILIGSMKMSTDWGSLLPAPPILAIPFFPKAFCRLFSFK